VALVGPAEIRFWVMNRRRGSAAATSAYDPKHTVEIADYFVPARLKKSRVVMAAIDKVITSALLSPNGERVVTVSGLARIPGRLPQRDLSLYGIGAVTPALRIGQ
jgi:hypothetical protein